MMMLVSVLWVLALHSAFAAEESCGGRCGTFNAQRRCQCDSMCVYHRSCCHDFQSVCRRKIARGDTFGAPEDLNSTVSSMDGAAITTTTFPNTTVATPDSTTWASSPTTDPDEVSCSGRPFDAFLQLKNGSIYAFRGEYFFELGESSVLPGYPKLIKDVWGIPGPIDAAFTRINCQGKSYLFKGDQYWRFEGDVLDDNYPRDISVGFENMPNDVDAAFAIPAPSFSGKEKAYFFKGDQYHQYEFKFQPSHEECVAMTRASPSVMFTHYTDLYDQQLEELFTELFMGPFQGQSKGPRLISRDWLGIKPPINAAMVGRIYLSPKTTPIPPAVRPPGRRRVTSKRRGRGRRQRGRHSRSLSFYLTDIFSYYYGDDYGSDDDDLGNAAPTAPPGPASKSWPVQNAPPGPASRSWPVQNAPPGPASRSWPVQNVYFFKSDKYYRVNLNTKRVDRVSPRYPRSIAKYWLGCDCKESAASHAEKR
ncbi:unnamed protein product [Lota lota]